MRFQQTRQEVEVSIKYLTMKMTIKEHTQTHTLSVEFLLYLACNLPMTKTLFCYG